MNRLYYMLLPLALTGCIKSDPSPVGPKINPSIVAPQIDRVYTVKEFLALPELRKKFFEMCANDPGQTERDPNCINVLSAERIASAGTSIPRSVP
jgi:hypothetical protein